MGTVVDQLNHLNETKDLIKNAIITKGVAVADEDTFRSYHEKILAISSGSSKQARYNAAAVFYDIDGTVLYDYTKEELNNLTELPPTPVKQLPHRFQSGIADDSISSNWTHTLSEIKEYVNKYSYIDVGTIYECYKSTIIAFYIPEEFTEGVTMTFSAEIYSPDPYGVPPTYKYFRFGWYHEGNEEDEDEDEKVVRSTGKADYWTTARISKVLTPGMHYLSIYPVSNSAGNEAIGETFSQHNIKLSGTNCRNFIKWASIGICVSDLGNVFKNSSLEYIYLNNYTASLPSRPFLATLKNSFGPNLKHLVVPSYMSIESDAFYGYKSLEHMIMNPQTPQGVVLENLPLKSLSIPTKAYLSDYGLRNSSSLTRLSIPESSSTLNTWQLYGLTSLRYLKFPKTITNIESECANFIDVILLDFSDHETIPSIYENPFGTLNSGSKILVPNSLLTEWKASWSEYADNIVGV